MMGKLPPAAEPVLIFNIVEQVGLQLAEENEAVAPSGKPETEKLIGDLLPPPKVALIEFVTEEPAVTDLSPELDKEKLKGWVVFGEVAGTSTV